MKIKIKIKMKVKRKQNASRTQANASNKKNKEEIEDEEESVKKNRTAFVPPSIDEVREYADSSGYAINAEQQPLRMADNCRIYRGLKGHAGVL